MFESISNFVAIVYERVGDFGLAFFLVIIIVNLRMLWWSFPKEIQRKIQQADTTDLGTWRMWQNALKVNRAIFSLIFGIFTLGIVLAEEPALWLKIFSSIVAIALFVSLVASLWISVLKNLFDYTKNRRRT